MFLVIHGNEGDVEDDFLCGILDLELYMEQWS